MKTKSLLMLLAAAGILYAVYMAQTHSNADIGEKAPAFTLPTKTTSIQLSDFRGKWVLLNFWATWCPPCRAEMPSLDELKNKMEGPDLKVLAVSVDEAGWPAVDAFLAREPVTLTVLLDARGNTASQYGVFELPQTFLIDPKGRIVREYQGPRDWMNPEVVSEIEHDIHGS